MNITISNDYHGSKTAIRPRGGHISASAWRSAMRRLCSIGECTCGCIRGEQPGLVGIELQHLPDGSVLVIEAGRM